MRLGPRNRGDILERWISIIRWRTTIIAIITIDVYYANLAMARNTSDLRAAVYDCFFDGLNTKKCFFKSLRKRL